METIDQFRGEYAWLSNFHRHPVWLSGWSVPFASAEHAFQACKAMTGEGGTWVRDAPSPQLAKSRGRQVRAYPDWDKRRKAVMLKVLLAKFSNPELGAMLLATGDAQLVEGNTWGDTFWGAVQLDPVPMDMAVWAPSGHADDLWWAGRNWLGRELMMVRAVLAGD